MAMADEKRDTEPMALTGVGRYRQGELWWTAAIGLLVSGALIVAAVWIRIESRPLPPSHPLASASASDEPAPSAPSKPGSVTFRLPADL
jgi:hypothetical protein